MVGLSEAFPKLERAAATVGDAQGSGRLYTHAESFWAILAKSTDVAAREISAFGFAEPESQALLSAFRKADLSGVLCSFQRAAGGGWAMEGLSFLGASNHLWRVRWTQRNGDSWIEIVGSGREDLTDRANVLARRLLRV